MPPAVLALALPAAIAGGATVASSVIGSRSAGSAARRQSESVDRSAALEARSAREALEFEKQKEAERRREWEDAQRKNFELYLTRRKDLEGYRRVGAGSIASIANPLYQPGDRKPGTISGIYGG